MARLFHLDRYPFILLLLSSWSMVSAHVIQIFWSPNPERDVQCYDVYRASSISSETNIARVSAVDSTYLDHDIMLGNIYYYRIVAVDSAGNCSAFSEPVEILADITSGGEAQEDMLPAIVELKQNHPNPFNPMTTLTYTVAQQAFISLAIYDGRGRKIRTLVQEEKSPGLYTVVWDARDEVHNVVRTGIYFARLVYGSSQEIRRLIFTK